MKLNSPLINKTTALVTQGVVRSWMSTLDFKAATYDLSVDPASPACRTRGIYIFWHEYIPLLMYLRGNCDLAMLMSRHRMPTFFRDWHCTLDLISFAVQRAVAVTGLSEK